MSLVGTPIVFPRLQQDLLLWMVDNERPYCCTAIALANATGSAVEHVVGEVIASATLAANADPKTQQGDFTDALLLERVTIPANSTKNVRALVRGPAICNFDEVERASEEESDADLRTRLANLVAKGVQFIREPSVQAQSSLNS